MKIEVALMWHHFFIKHWWSFLNIVKACVRYGNTQGLKAKESPILSSHIGREESFGSKELNYTRVRFEV
jgi:hypothetical protein